MTRINGTSAGVSLSDIYVIVVLGAVTRTTPIPILLRLRSNWGFGGMYLLLRETFQTWILMQTMVHVLGIGVTAKTVMMRISDPFES